MDSTDIGILRALGENCRASYQEMGRSLGMTANAIKKRVNKLVDNGTIHSFVVYLSFAMIDAESYLAILTPEGTNKEDEILAQIVKNPHVFSTGSLSDGTCIVFAEYEGANGKSDFEQFLNSLNNVAHFELHTERAPKGNKVEFKPLQIRVLNSLVEDPRAAATEIAEKTGLTPRRVRKIIQQLLESGGVNFVTRLNLNAGSGVIYYAQIRWDESQGDHHTVENWLEKNFSGQYFDSHISATSPMMLSLFVVDHLRDAESMSRSVCQGSMIESVKTIFPFPTKKNVRLQKLRLEELLAKTNS
ncbi:MAG: winged helix-turn-helix transcriptional regulator [Candidatus Thorarchaeota archaeon]